MRIRHLAFACAVLMVVALAVGCAPSPTRPNQVHAGLVLHLPTQTCATCPQGTGYPPGLDSVRVRIYAVDGTHRVERFATVIDIGDTTTEFRVELDLPGGTPTIIAAEVIGSRDLTGFEDNTEYGLQLYGEAELVPGLEGDAIDITLEDVVPAAVRIFGSGNYPIMTWEPRAFAISYTASDFGVTGLPPTDTTVTGTSFEDLGSHFWVRSNLENGMHSAFCRYVQTSTNYGVTWTPPDR